MLKKFLKFLRGGSENSEHLEGSYLDELLDRVRPRVAEQLEVCPEHDAMPLLVAEILREVTEDQFDEKPRCPVVDAQSPPLDPPPPPEAEETDVAPPPAPDEPPEAPEEPGGESEEAETDESPAEESQSEESQSEESQAEESQSEESQAEEDETGEIEIDASETDEADADESDVESEESTEDETAEEPEQSDGESEGESSGGLEDEESSDHGEDSSTDGDTGTDGEADATGGAGGEGDSETADGPDREMGEEGDEEGEGESEGDDGAGTDEVVESDAEPLKADSVGSAADSVASGPLADDLGSTERSVELSPNQAPEQSELDEDEEPEIHGPRVDTEVVLEMGRVFLGMLVENDALPVDLQMSIEEIRQARKLLEGYFLEGTEVESRAREMLRMVEEKFDEGLFSQARILLQLFDADRQTRIENDRNLFYDEMILRFGIQRRHPVGEDIEEKFTERVRQFEGEPEEFEELLVWLSETIYVTFDVYGRDQRAVEQWREISETSVRPGASERLLEVIPPVRWRLLDEYSRPVAEIIGEQLTADYVEEYVTNHVKTCYFILRAVGDTGLEGYLDVFFDWTEETFDVDGPALMPWIYTETTANERLIDEIFHELYLAHFESDVEAIREEWDRDAIEGAVEEVVDDVAEADLSEIPPGHYDFGRFVLDKLFAVEYGEADFPFKMHRLA